MLTPKNLLRAFALLPALILALAASARAADGIKASPEKEKELLALLRSDAQPADKAIACKKLAIDGSSAAVPDLAKLLPNPQLSSWARIALEAIPGPAADEALRSAAKTLDGELLVGTINSIGVRRDAKAVDVLTTRLKDKDPQVAAAAAVALGHIGNSDAAKTLRASLAANPVKVRSAVAEGCILCAEQLEAAGKSAEAAKLYDEVRKAELPKQRKIEATRGLVLARGQEGIPLLVETLNSKDKKFAELGLKLAREFPGSEVDKALAGELAHATPQHAALLVTAMADRPKTVVVSAVVKAAEQGPKPVRVAALNALARVGDASSVPVLLAAALDNDTDLAQAAKASLAELKGEKVNSQIVALLPKAEGKQRLLLIELVGQRRLAATPELIKALDQPNKELRLAALVALGETVAQSDLNVLVSEVIAPKHAEDAEVAKKALATASIRMPDREACAQQLASAVDKASSVQTKVGLLEILAAVGGKAALNSVAAAANSKDEKLQDTASALLGKWSTEDAAPVLLELATKGPSEKYQSRALRGYIRIARQFVLPEEQRVAMCQKAFAAAHQPAEQKMVLDALKQHPSKGSLEMATKIMAVPELRTDATAATLVIAQALGSKGVDVSDALAKAGYEKVKLEIVKAEYGAQATQKDVTAVVRKRAAADLPVVALPGGYNKNFGGDPMPGVAKQLKIQYRINGKPAEASFAEDAVVILPMPK